MKAIRGLFASAILALLLGLLPLESNAQDRQAAAFWLVSQVNVPAGDRLSVNVMVQNRVTNDLNTYQRTVVRPWVGIKLPRGFDLSIGYDAHVFENPLEFVENRAWQRIGYTHDFGTVSGFTHFWLEERFFPGASQVALRGRFQVGTLIDLPREFDLIVRNEFFFNLNTTNVIRRTGLGEDHFFAGISRPFGRHLRLETGYLLQYLDPIPALDIYNHTWVVGVAVGTPQVVDLF